MRRIFYLRSEYFLYFLFFFNVKKKNTRIEYKSIEQHSPDDVKEQFFVKQGYLGEVFVDWLKLEQSVNRGITIGGALACRVKLYYEHGRFSFRLCHEHRQRLSDAGLHNV